MNTHTPESTQSYTEWKNALSNKEESTQTTAPTFFGVSWPSSKEIYDEDVVKDVKNFMIYPCCIHQGKIYASSVRKFKNLDEIKEFFKTNADIILYQIRVVGDIFLIRYSELY